MNHISLSFSPETRLEHGYFSNIISETRSRYELPAVAVTVMNPEEILLQEIQVILANKRNRMLMT